MAIIDGFIFFNEVDVLAMRLEELYPVVDHFLLVDSSQTFRGDLKERYFNLSDPRWEKYAYKITHIGISFFGVPDDPWKREAYQRNKISEYAKARFDGEDILLVSDVDEIPRRSAVQGLRDNFQGSSHFVIRSYTYALNVRAGEDRAIKACRVKDVKSAEELRVEHPNKSHAIENGGWHFSSMGNAEFIRTKLKSFSHIELDLPQYTDVEHIEKRIRNLKDLYDRADFTLEEIDDTWPEAVKNNREYWEKYVWKR